MKYFMIILVVIGCQSCQPILRMLAGVKKPKYENGESLKRFMQEHEFDVDSTYVLQKEKYFFTVTKDLVFPNLLIFDKNGDRIKEAKSCVPDESYSIDLLLEYGVKDSLRNFHFYTSLMADTIGNPVEISDDGEKAIIIWMIATGKSGAKRVNIFEQVLRNSKNKINVYYLNIDPQEFWEEVGERTSSL